ncbi:MAG: hypothetical protein RIR51_1425 [Bacteroidota bacterium]|jgi:ABC-type multidrug transport system ATPase subunit
MLKIKIDSYKINNNFSISGINLRIKNGEIFSLIGRSGSGKSSLAKIMVGKTPFTDFELNINGKEIFKEGLMKFYDEFGYVPQSLIFNPHHTVLEFLKYVYQFEKIPIQEKKIQKAIKEFKLKSLLNTKIQSLSGGERQKLAILEVVSRPIECLVLDEPFSQLDPGQKKELSSLIIHLVKDLNIPCLLISHEMGDVLKWSDRIGIMHNGKIVGQGNIEKLIESKNPIVQSKIIEMVQWYEEIIPLINKLNNFSK